LVTFKFPSYPVLFLADCDIVYSVNTVCFLVIEWFSRKFAYVCGRFSAF